MLDFEIKGLAKASRATRNVYGEIGRYFLIYYDENKREVWTEERFDYTYSCSFAHTVPGVHLVCQLRDHRTKREIRSLIEQHINIDNAIKNRNEYYKEAFAV